MAAFGIAMLMHVATNLLHMREDMLRCATGVARVTGALVIAQIEAGDEQSAVSALKVLRDEPLVSMAEVLLTNGKSVATYRRGEVDAHPGAAIPTLPLDPANPKLFMRGGHFHLTAPVVRDGKVLGFIHI